ncbi:MAG: PAS domain S-box protein [Bacteroidales bacterium]|nr:PAS domain S-box protein [Bacteroidales bacterium]
MRTKKPTYEELEKDYNRLLSSYDRLVENEEKFLLSQQIANIAHYTLDISTGKWSGSKQLYQIFGIDESVPRDMEHWFQLIHPNHYKIVEDYWVNNVLKQKKPFNKQYKIISKKSGNEKWIHNQGTLIYDDNNKPVQMFGTIQDITEQKKTEEALEASEEQLKHVFNNSPAIMFLLNEKLEIIKINAAGRKFSVRNINELTGKLPGDVFKCINATNSTNGCGGSPECGNCTIRKTIKQTFETKDPQHKILKKLVAKIEEEIQEYSLLISTVLLKETPSMEMLVVFDDVTELKTAERKLKDGEERWYFSVDGSGLGLWDWNAVTNEVFFSKQWKKMLGYEEHEISGSLEEWDKRVHPDDKEKVYADLNKHFEEKTKIYQNEHRVLTKEGNYKWVLDRGKVISWTKDGKPERVIGTHTDIDEQKRNQQVFAENVAKFKLLFEQSPIGIFITGTSGTIIDGNKKIIELLQLTSIETARSINIFKFSPLRDSGYVEAFKKCLKTKKKQHFELFYNTEKGNTIYLSSYIFPLFDEKNNVLHVYTMMEDVSKRKHIERELKESQQRLELFFKQSAIGFFFMMLDKPIVWNENIDKNATLDFVFKHQHITKINEAMLQQYGAQPEDFIGLTPNDLFRHRIKHGKEIWREFFDNGKLHIDTEEQKLDGSPIIINGDYICLYDDKDRIIGHFGVQREVSTERKAEEKLRNSETNFRTFFNSIDSYLFILDKSGKIIEINQAVTQKLEYTPEDVIGQNIIALHPADRKEDVNKHFSELLKGNCHDCSVPLISKRGKIIPVETFANLGVWNGKPAIFKVSKDISALRLSEEKFSKVFHFNPALTAISTIKNGTFIEANATFYETMEYTPKEVIGKTSVELKMVSQKEREQMMDKFIKEGGLINEEINYRTKSGKVITTISTTHVINIGSNEYFLTTALDITKIKENEKELLNAKVEIEKSNRQLKEAQRISMLGSWSHNYKTQKTELSDEIYNIFEITDKSEQPNIEYFINAVHPDDMDALKDEFNSSKELHIPFDITHRVILSNKKIKHVRQRGNIELDKSGETRLIRATIQDVTKERQLQSDLVKSEVLKKNILASQPMMIWVKDIEGVYIACNSQFERFFGAKEEDIIGKTDYDFVDKEQADFFRKHDRNAAKNNRPTINEEWITYPDNGEKALLETTKTPLRDDNGEIFGILGVAYNITKRTEREEILRSAKKEADRANKLKSEFLANMSHEIRTPLNAVLGYSEILAKKLEEFPEYLAYIEGITKSGKNLISLINDILDLSKIEAGKMEILPEPVNFHDLLKDIAQIFAAKIQIRKIDFKLHIDPQLPQILMLDQKRIRQILFNLVGNALKYTEKGSVVIDVKSNDKIISEQKVGLIIEVKDTGIGIPKQLLTDIFEAFRQSRKQSQKIEGTGLGLSITKRLVEAMDGEISVESKVGEGSTFRVILKDIIIPGEDVVKSIIKSTGDIQNIQFKNPVILLADDVKSNLEVLHHHLQELNCKVYMAINGAEALQMIDKHKFDLIIMDIQMPILDGYEATKRIKANKATANIPVVALTAFAMKDQHKKYENIFDDYLIKPLEINDLANSLKKFLPWKSSISKVVSKDEEALNFKQFNATTTKVLKQINDQLVPLFEELQYAFDTKECISFCNTVIKLAKENNIPQLDKFGNKLKKVTHVMNFSKIQLLLSEFDEFINELKGKLNEK